MIPLPEVPVLQLVSIKRAACQMSKVAENTLPTPFGHDRHVKGLLCPLHATSTMSDGHEHDKGITPMGGKSCRSQAQEFHQKGILQGGNGCA